MFRSAAGGVMRQRRDLVALGVVLFAIMPVVILSVGATALPPLLFVLLQFFLLGTWALRRSREASKNATFDHGTLTLEDGLLALDGRPVVRREALKQLVGTDGIVVRWLGRSRFFEHARIRSVATYRDRVGTKEFRGVAWS